MTNEEKLNIMGRLAALTAFAGGLALATPTVGCVVTGTTISSVGLNLLSNIFERKGQAIKEWYLRKHDGGLVNHDVQFALQRALIRALEALRDACLAQSGRDLSESQQHGVRLLFEALREQAAQPAFGAAMKLDEAQTALQRDPAAAEAAIWERLTTALPELAAEFAYYDYALAFLRPRLSQEIQFWFAEELKTQDPEHAKAWIGYQKLLLEAILAETRAGLQATAAQMNELPEKVVAALTAQLAALTPTPAPRIGLSSETLPPVELFIDRRDALAAFGKFFANQHKRYFLLPGVGGIGKTALLAKAVAEFAPDGSPSHVFYHAFNPQMTPDATTLLLELHGFLEEHGDRRMEGVLRDPNLPFEAKLNALFAALAADAYCLIFDDCHLLLDDRHRVQHADLRRLFERFAAGGYQGKVILSSRIQPRFDRANAGIEAVWTLDDLPEDHAIALMRELGYPDDAPELLQAVYRLAGGHPETLRLLAGLQRRRSLKKVVADMASWGDALFDRLLDEALRGLNETAARLLLAAAVHRLPLTEAAFEFHAQPTPGTDGKPTPNPSQEGNYTETPLLGGVGGGFSVAAALDTLVDKCVLRFDREAETYRLHGLTREYLLRTADADELRGIHARAAEYYESLEWNENPTRFEHLTEWLECRWHLFQAQNYERATRLALQVSRLLHRFGLHDAHLALLTDTLNTVTSEKDRGTTLNNISQIYDARGDYATALTYLEQSLAIQREIGDKAGEGTTLNNLSQIYDARGDYATALTYLEQSLAIRREIGDKAGEGATLNNLSQIFKARGDYATALTYLEQCLTIFREIGDKAHEGTTLNNLSQIYDARGDYATALTYLEQSLAIQREIGDKAGEGTTLNNLSQIFKARGDYATALTYLEQSLAIQREIGDKAGEGTTLNNLSQIYDARGDYATALTYLEQSLAIQREIGHKAGEGATLNNLSQIYDARGDYATALTYLEQSLAIRREIGHKAGEGATLNNLSQIYAARGDYATALTYLEQSLAIQREIGDKAGEGTTLNNLSQIFKARGDYATALTYLEQSLAICREIGDIAGMCATLFNMGHIHAQNNDLSQALAAWVTVYQLAKPRNIANILDALKNLAEQIGLSDGLYGWERLASQMEEASGA